jgi:hypothetical protein
VFRVAEREGVLHIVRQKNPRFCSSGTGLVLKNCVADLVRSA